MQREGLQRTSGMRGNVGTGCEEDVLTVSSHHLLGTAHGTRQDSTIGGPHRGLPDALGARVAAVMLLLFCWNATAASAQPTHGVKDPVQAERPPCTTATEVVSHAAQQVCGGAAVETALRSIGMQEAEACGRRLVSLGLPNALDLRLLGGGPEAEEVMAELKAAGILVGDRAKVRLLVGDRAHLSWVSAASVSTDYMYTAISDGEGLPQRRRLQADATDTASKADAGMSMDTIAIMLTVLVGMAGYAMQAYLAQRAERSLEAAAQELHVHEQEREREHRQVVAQDQSDGPLAGR